MSFARDGKSWEPGVTEAQRRFDSASAEVMTHRDCRGNEVYGRTSDKIALFVKDKKRQCEFNELQGNLDSCETNEKNLKV